MSQNCNFTEVVEIFNTISFEKKVVKGITVIWLKGSYNLIK